jgi:SNF2 family DNA or RNA helicase
MGLGKTIQALAAINQSGALPVLVVCPNSMIYGWCTEINKWIPNLVVSLVVGTAAKRKKALEPGADVYIIGWANTWRHSRLQKYGSYAMKDGENQPGALNTLGFRTVIADEAHRMTQPSAKQTRAVWALMHSAEYRWALTGTPITGNLAGLWGILHGIAPEEYPQRQGFIERYTLHADNGWGGLEVFGVHPTHRDEFYANLDSRMLRRTKAEVLPDLPPKTYTTRWLPLTGEQEKAYKQMNKDMMAVVEDDITFADSPLTKMIRLLQFASATPVLDEDGGVVAFRSPSNKLDALDDIIEEAEGKPLVIFTVSRKLAELTVEHLRKQFPDDPTVTVTGLVTGQERQDAIDAFQAGQARFIVCTMAAGGEGITLTAADTAVFLQRSWSLVHNRQAEDRIHRIGQEAEAVTIIDVISQGTVEPRVHDVMFEKGENMEGVVRDRQRLAALLQA